MTRDPITVFYNSHADDDLYGMIRGTLKPGMRLLTLETDDDAERRAKLAEAQVAIVAATPMTRELIDAAPRLRLVHHQGVGYQDTVDCAALSARGIALALTPAGTTATVAETTILMMLAVLRHLTFADAELRQGRWHINSLRAVSRNLGGRCIGYVGMGRIGQAVARLARAFGACGLYADPVVTLSTETEVELSLRKANLEAVLARADIVTLHLPSGAGTRHIIDRAAIAGMKDGAILVNTARGSLVDEAALTEALTSGKLAGAGLDVFDPEPPAPGSALLDLPNVVLTPHIAGGTRDAFEEKMRTIFANIERFFTEGKLDNRVCWPREPARGA